MMCSRRPELAVSSARQPSVPAHVPCKTDLILLVTISMDRATRRRASTLRPSCGPVKGRRRGFLSETPVLPLLFEPSPIDPRPWLALRASERGIGAAVPLKRWCSGVERRPSTSRTFR